MDDLIGQSLGRYHIIEKLGEGGMAVVYKAYDTRLERDVALKVIRKDAFPLNKIERMLKRFEREAKSMAKLSHANIVKVLDYGEHDGNPYFVMELVPGGTLNERLGSPIPWQQALNLVEPVASALAYAHGEGILHRDVKPANILITKTGEPVLTDFGIAKLLESDEGNTLTGTGVGVGTPEYMAPEQGMGKELDGRADIYALGIVLFELVTGHKPYSADTPLAVILKQVHDPLPEPRGFVPGLPVAMEKMLYKALAKNPEDRYQSMDEFLLAMQKMQDQPANKKNRLSTQIIKPQAMVEPDEFATTDLLEAGEDVRSAKRIRKKATPSGGGSRQTLKLAGIVLGGLVVVVLAIGAVSGWFSAKVPAATKAPAPTGTAAIVETATEVPAATEAPTMTESTATELPYGIGSTMVSEVDGMPMVFVPAGEFIMGSPEGIGDFDEDPQHLVYLSSYWIDQTEVTNSMYEQCVNAGACTPPEDYSSPTRVEYFGNIQFADYPIVNVNWNQAKTYCEWAGRQLPTEAQWEKAARGTDGRTYPWGETPPNENLANYNENIGDTTAVGSYPKGMSPYGALDMSGNVWEWVADWYGENYYSQSPYDNPAGPSTGKSRVIRLGSWFNVEIDVTTTDRGRDDPKNYNYYYGFRCALNEDITVSQNVATEAQSVIGSIMTSQVDGMTMVYVPAGEFIMGSVEGVGEDNEHPQHTVYLDAYWIDQTEVTNGQYSLCVSSGGCTAPLSVSSLTREWYYGNPQFKDYPVIYVDWNQANDYCEWAGRQLPTEAQWEKAARGTDGRTYPWGNQEPTANLANYGQIQGDTTAVGSYTEGASPYGALDMTGNVWEWVADWYGADYYASQSGWENPQGPQAGEGRVLRGGSWYISGNYLRTSSRYWYYPMNSDDYSLGFRCSLSGSVSP